MGGAIVQQTLLDRPHDFPAAVLVSTGARIKVMPQVFDLVERDVPALLELIAQVVVHPETPGRLTGPVLQSMRHCGPDVLAADFKACDAFDARDRIGQIQTPTLVFTGEVDPLTPAKLGISLATEIAGARRVHISRAGHLLTEEQPKAFQQAVHDFLSELGLTTLGASCGE
jgi:pimeloyl-ACP methyl ester carboxylesterase